MKNFLGMLCILLIVLSLMGCGQKEKANVYTGTVETEEINIQAEEAGLIKDIFVEEGMKVEKGQIIAKLDDTIYRIEAKKAGSQLAEADARYAEGKTGTRKEQIAQAENRVKEIEASIKGQEKVLVSENTTLNKYQALFAEGAITEKQLLDQKDKVTSLSSNLVSMKAEREALVNQRDLLVKGLTADSLKQLAASKDQFQANLTSAELRLLKTEIKAPVTGIISKKILSLGELANPGSTIAVMFMPQEKWVKVFIPENKLNLVQLGEKCTLTVDAYPGKEFAGKITYIAEQAEFTPKNMQTKEDRVKLVYAVKVKITGDNEELKPGMPVDVTFANGGTK